MQKTSRLHPFAILFLNLLCTYTVGSVTFISLRKPNMKIPILFIYSFLFGFDSPDSSPSHVTQNHTVYLNIIHTDNTVPNDRPSNGDIPCLVWSCMWAMTGELWPRNCLHYATHSPSHTSLTSHAIIVRGYKCVVGYYEFAGSYSCVCGWKLHFGFACVPIFFMTLS